MPSLFSGLAALVRWRRLTLLLLLLLLTLLRALLAFNIEVGINALLQSVLGLHIVPVGGRLRLLLDSLKESVRLLLVLADESPGNICKPRSRDPYVTLFVNVSVNL